MKNPLNCWKTLKPTKPQYKYEIELDMMVTKVEKISWMNIWLNPKCSAYTIIYVK